MFDTTTEAGKRTEARLWEEVISRITTVRSGGQPANEVPPYVEKYRESIVRIGFDPEGFARAYSVAVRVIPERWQVW